MTLEKKSQIKSVILICRTKYKILNIIRIIYLINPILYNLQKPLMKQSNIKFRNTMNF